MELWDVMRGAGTCREFRPDPVPDDVLVGVLDAIRWAPQGGNRQPLRLVVIRDAGVRTQLAEWYREHWDTYAGRYRLDPDHPVHRFVTRLHEVPVVIVVCAQAAALYVTDAHLGRTPVVGGASIYPAVQNLLLACRDRGLGAALTTLLCASEPQVRQLLALPDEVITAAHVFVGWPATPLPTRLRRRPLSALVHADRWGTPLLNE